MIIGTVRFFNTKKGFGFIAPENGEKYTLVRSIDVQAAGMEQLCVGQKVSYDRVIGRRGRDIANNLKPMGDV
ncbi:MAG: cold-shock protein [Gammaproteobacteria bacterium]|nr:cold-shock protein [Gammaproteobacteria bacterium]